MKNLFKSYSRYRKDHRSDVFEESTYNAYLQEARAFILSAAGVDLSEVKTKKKVKEILSQVEGPVSDKLKQASYEKSSNSWRKLRRSLVVTFRAAGLSKQAELLQGVKNSAPLELRKRNVHRNRRIRKVDDDTYKNIMRDRVNNHDIDSCLLIILCENLGIRPCEAKNIKILKVDAESITVYIRGAKKPCPEKMIKLKKEGLIVS